MRIPQQATAVGRAINEVAAHQTLARDKSLAHHATGHRLMVVIEHVDLGCVDGATDWH